MHWRAFVTALLVASLCLAQEKTNDIEKPFRATDEEGKPKSVFALADTVLLEFRNVGPDPVECVRGIQPELTPNEGFGLERWTGKAWESALRPFETGSYKASVGAGERLVRRWPTRWGVEGRYRATLVCGQTALEPVEFEVGVVPLKKAPPDSGGKQGGGFEVTDVDLRPDEAKVLGQCPATVRFTGSITTNGPGTVTYTFVRSDGATGPSSTVEFKEGGTQTVTTTWTLGGVALPQYEGWQSIKVLTPNEVESGHETGRFFLSCSPAPGK